MNRPKFKDYFTETLYNHEDDYLDYIVVLEKYCDKLEKALNKACKELSEFSLCPNGFYEDFKTSDIKCGTSEICDFIHENGKCWKEWALKDDNASN